VANGLPSANEGLFAMNFTEDIGQYLIKTVSGTVWSGAASGWFCLDETAVFDPT